MNLPGVSVWFFGDKSDLCSSLEFYTWNCLQIFPHHFFVINQGFKSDIGNVQMKPGHCGGPSPFLYSVVLVGRLSQFSSNVTFPHSAARTECSYIVSLCIWPDRVQQNTTDVFSCLRRKMYSFILFHPLPPASCPFCVSVKCHCHLLCPSEEALPST